MRVDKESTLLHMRRLTSFEDSLKCAKIDSIASTQIRLVSINSTMLSCYKPFTSFPVQISRTIQNHHVRSLTIRRPVRSTSDSGNNTTSSDDVNASPTLPPRITPPETVEIRFKRGSRKRRKKQEEGFMDKMPSSKQPLAPKDWESMTLTEKATELYVGEKGLLFWLNKLAYASIFVVIGGWILFRFVGPALNLYQLDAPPLSPSSLLKGS